MATRNLDPDAVANVHEGNVDKLGGNTDQPELELDEAGHVPEPVDAADYQAPKAETKASGGMSTKNAGALIGKPDEESKPAKKTGGKAS